jgi:hypothetical protein
MVYQWEVSRLSGASYSIRNIASRRYLGMKVGAKVTEGYDLLAVDHVFPWDIMASSQPPFA